MSAMDPADRARRFFNCMDHEENSTSHGIRCMEFRGGRGAHGCESLAAEFREVVEEEAAFLDGLHKRLGDIRAKAVQEGANGAAIQTFQIRDIIANRAAALRREGGR